MTTTPKSNSRPFLRTSTRPGANEVAGDDVAAEEVAEDEVAEDEAVEGAGEVDSEATESEEKENGQGRPNEMAADQGEAEHADVDFTIDFVQTHEKLSHAAQLAQAPFAAVNQDRSLAARIATEFEALKTQWLQANANRKTLPTRLYDQFDQQARVKFAPPARSSRSRAPSERCVNAFDSFVQV